MTVLHAKATDMMRVAACLHPNETRPQIRAETQQKEWLDTFAENDRAVSPARLQTVLPKSIPRTAVSIRMLLLLHHSSQQ